MKKRVGVLRVVVALSVVSLLAAQLPGLTGVAFATPRCSSGLISTFDDSNNDPLGLEPQDYAVGSAIVLGAIGVVYAITGHKGGGGTASATQDGTVPHQVNAGAKAAPAVAAAR